jgi:hypothetical protein
MKTFRRLFAGSDPHMETRNRGKNKRNKVSNFERKHNF